jgi:hypothetical protein
MPKKTYLGTFNDPRKSNINFMSPLLFLILRGGKLEIYEDKFILYVVKIGEIKKIEIPKSDIQSIENYFRTGIKLSHLNTNLANPIVFSTLWHFGMLKTLRSLGYAVTD